MSDKLKENELVHHHGRKRSEPHEGHGGTRYEGIDASAKMVIWSLIIIAVTLIITVSVTVPVQRMLRKTTPTGELPSPLAPARIVPKPPLLEVHPPESLQQLREHNEAILNSYGKNAQGHFHIPIDRAMDAVVARLRIAPDAPQGLTTPGGEGREFSHSLSDMPPAYQHPAIRGEIEKHAQK